MDHKTRLILGCGYVAERVAKRWLSVGDRVLAVTRSTERVPEIEKLGVEPIVWNWLEPAGSLFELLASKSSDHVSTVLIAVSHAGPSHALGLENLLQSTQGLASSPHVRWIYLSTTGVFADPNDDRQLWVDESSHVLPTRPGSINALAAERWFEQSSLEHVVLRPSGIYGPGRIPNVQPIRDGQAMQVDPDSYLNLIHVEDLAHVIVEVAQLPWKNRLYCVSDGNSVQRKEYYSFIAKKLQLPEPRYSEYSGMETSRRRGQGNKRVSNARLVEDYSIRFQFPDYRIGLTPLLSEISGGQ